MASHLGTNSFVKNMVHTISTLHGAGYKIIFFNLETIFLTPCGLTIMHEFCWFGIVVISWRDHHLHPTVHVHGLVTHMYFTGSNDFVNSNFF